MAVLPLAQGVLLGLRQAMLLQPTCGVQGGVHFHATPTPTRPSCKRVNTFPRCAVWLVVSKPCSGTPHLVSSCVACDKGPCYMRAKSAVQTMFRPACHRWLAIQGCASFLAMKTAIKRCGAR